ncbi:MAG: adenylate/guanylate cyclase domain-containing protein, partial [Planctomycetota bacterium]
MVHSTEGERGFLALALFAAGIGLSLLLVRVGALYGALAGAGALVGLLAADYAFAFRHNQVLGIAYPLLAVAFVYIAVTVSRYFLIGREARFVRDAFSHYLAPDVVETLVSRPDALRLGGERRTLTVLFSDVRGFTTLSEGMAPDALAAFLNEYMTAMTGIVMEQKGTVDKFIGDAIMAFWGAPLPNPAHARDAVSASLTMLRRLDGLREEWRRRGLPDIDIGIGINTGEMTVGNMGSDSRFDYTVIGDNVNLASRLEGLNKPYGTRLLVTEATRAALGEGVCCRRIDRVRVKGKAEPVAIYEPLLAAPPDEALRDEVQAFHDAQDAYWAGRFSEARTAFDALHTRYGHHLYSVYRDRADSFLLDPPPPDWDGVWTFTTK